MKAYIKPVLRYENFELSVNIAGTCATPATTTEPEIDFGDKNPTDVYTPETSTSPSQQAACYTTGTADQKTFNS